MMRRILRVMTVALVVAAMMLAMAMPAFAAKPAGFQLVCAHPESPAAQIFLGPTVADVFAQATTAGFTRNECTLSVVQTS